MHFPQILYWNFIPKTANELNVYKAITGLYLGVSMLWVLGVFKSSLLKTALITNMVFMLGLGFGRLFSMLVDGTPTLVYTLGMLAELFLGFYGVWVLKYHSRTL